jgi:hypothetical protein
MELIIYNTVNKTKLMDGCEITPNFEPLNIFLFDRLNNLYFVHAPFQIFLGV